MIRVGRGEPDRWSINDRLVVPCIDTAHRHLKIRLSFELGKPCVFGKAHVTHVGLFRIRNRSVISVDCVFVQAIAGRLLDFELHISTVRYADRPLLTAD